MKILEQTLLNKFSTFRMGGPAQFFVIASSAEELQEAQQWARSKGIKYFILGGGSNLLFPDTGFDGLVIKPNLDTISFDGDTCSVGATVMLTDLITITLRQGLTGLEFAAGIPGTVGGAIRGNAGTFGVSISDVIETVNYISEDTFKQVSAPNNACVFKYRDSLFKTHNHIITSVQLRLHHGDVAESKKIIDERIAQRHANHPLEPSAGCIFKNIEFAKVDADSMRARGIDLDRFSKYKKIPSGFLIEQLGLKGKRIGGAMISERHANYIINTGGAKFEDVVKMISFIKQQVRDTYGIQLEEEVHIVT